MTCGGGSAGNVSVNFTLSGATYGTDYTLSGSGYTITGQTGTTTTGTIIMPGDGPTTATIYVEPCNLGIIGGSETLTFDDRLRHELQRDERLVRRARDDQR